MKLSVIIPCYNGAGFIANQLEAIVQQNWSGPWEVIVADNGSTDQSVAIVESFRSRLPELRIVDASQKRGPAYATNVGACAATGEAFVFTDADDEVSSGWLTAMGEALLKYDFVACGVDVEKLNPPWLHESRNHTQRDALQKLPYPPYLPHAGGSTLGVKRWVFESAGGFDEEMFAVQDALFCWKVQLRGIALHFVPNAMVHTRYRQTFGGMYRQARMYGQYSTLMYKKARAWGCPKIPHPWKEGVASWKMVWEQARWARSRGELAWCVFKLGYRIGRLRGSIKHGVLAI